MKFNPAQYLLKQGHRYSKRVILLISVISLIALLTLDDLSMSVSTDSLMTSHGKEKQWYDHALKTFGETESAVIVFHDDNLFVKSKLVLIKKIADQLEQLPFIKHTISIFNQKNYKSVDGSISSNPYCTATSKTAIELEQIKSDILFNPIMLNQLFSDDAKTMSIQLVFDPLAKNSKNDRLTQEAIELIIKPLRGKIEQVYQIGDNSIRNAIQTKMVNDQETLLPLSLLMLFVMLLITLRCISGAIIPMLTGGLSILWTLAFMATFNIPINVMTAIVPALLVIIGSTEDVHLLASYYGFRRDGVEHHKSLKLLNNQMGTAVLLTAFTTYAGFLSIMTNNIEIVQQFGLVASTGLLFNFIITLLLVPAWLNLSRSKIETNSPNIMVKKHYRGMNFMMMVCNLSQKYSKHTLTIVTLITLLSFFSLSFVHVNSNALDYFKSEEKVSVNTQQIEEQLVGIESFSIVLISPIEDTFLKVKYLNEVKAIQDVIKQSGLFDKSISFVDYMEFVDAIMNEDTSGEFELPYEDDLLEEYNLFLDQQDVKSYINEKYNQARIVVWHKLHNSSDLNKAVTLVKEKVQRLRGAGIISPGLTIRFTGQSILNSVAAESIALGQIESLIIMLIIIWALVSLLFANTKAGLIAMVPNILPIMILFAIMGILDIPLNTSTVMVAAIAIGLGVDNTIHFMVRYHGQCKKLGHKGKALDATVKEELTPIMATTFSLTMGFLVLMTSDFTPISLFGGLSAMVIVLSFISTFTVLPILLCTTRLVTIWDFLDITIKHDVLTNCVVFSGLKPSQIKRIVLEGQIQTFNPGEVIIGKDDSKREMYIILDGEVDLFEHSNTDNFLYQLSDGEVFGELSLLLDTERTRVAKAVSKTNVITLDWPTLEYIGQNRPKISNQLFFNLSEILRHRIRYSGKALFDDQSPNNMDQ